MQATFRELEQLCAKRGVNLLHVYLEAGLHDSTYYRHMHGRNGMTLTTYQALVRTIEKLAGKAAA